MKNLKLVLFAALITLTAFSAKAQITATNISSKDYKREVKLYAAATKKENEGDFQGAIAIYNEALEISPNVASTYGNIGREYISLATTTKGNLSDNSEYYEKATDALKKAISISPNKEFYCNLGAAYYNKATQINDKMNAITGNSKEDMQNWSELKERRDNLFEHSQPYFEKAYSLYSVNELTLTGEDLKIYKSILSALEHIYKVQNKIEQSQEMHKKSATLY